MTTRKEAYIWVKPKRRFILGIWNETPSFAIGGNQ